MPEDLATSAPSEAQPCTTAGVTPASPPGYELLDEVGRGGMGVVYRARDVALGRDVAVKLLADRYSLDSPASQRFVNEARITGQLQHPGIPAVHQVGHLPDGRPFLAMKLIKGSTLEAVLKDRPDPSAERGRLLAVFEAVCQAVGYAHAHRVIHRDLKPANVMVGAFGEVQVMDWGLAKVLGEEDTAPAADGSAPEVTRAWTQVSPTPETGSHTQAGSLVGTPAFIPPEQAAGELAKVEERADVFGLGALLAVILTGKPPYVAESFESVRVLAVRGKLEDCLARLEGCGAEPELVSLCRQCLAFEPADRPRDAGEVAQAVAQLRSLAEERARTAEREKAAADARSEEQRRKRRWQLAAAGVIVVALTGGLVGLGAYLRAQAQANADLAAKNSDLAAANEREKQAKDELESSLYLKRIALAERALAVNNVGGADELLQECPPELRAWEWHYLMRLRHDSPLILRGQAGTTNFSPDGRLIASAGGQLKVWDARTGKELWTVAAESRYLAFSPDGKHLAAGPTIREATTGKEVLTLRGATGGWGCCVAYSPDGKRLATNAPGNAVKIWDAITGRELLTLQQPGKFARDLVFHPDGQLLAVAAGKLVRVWDLTTAREVVTLTGHFGEVWGVAFSPDGQRLASASWDETVKVWNLKGRNTLTLPATNGLMYSVAFSPDGRRLASACYDKTVKIWDASTGQEILTLRGHTDAVWSVAFDGKGHHLVSASLDGTVRVWDGTPLETRPRREVRTLGVHSGQVFAVGYSPDGRRLVSAGNALVKLWDAETGKELCQFRGHTNLVLGAAFSPDNQRVASGGWDGTVRIWDANTGQELFSLDGNSGPLWSIAFSPDNQHVAALDEGAIKVWDLETKKVVRTFKQNGQTQLAFSPDGKRLASGSIGSVGRVYDLTTGQVRSLVGHEHIQVWAAAFSPDGRLIATGCVDTTVRIWDAATGKELRTLTGHSDRIMALTFSPDSKRLVSGCWDGTAKVWDVNSGKEQHTLRGHIGVVHSIAFHPDGRYLATGSGYRSKGEVTVWDLELLDAR